MSSVLVMVYLVTAQQRPAEDARLAVRNLLRESKRNREAIVSLGLEAIRPLFEVGTIEAIELAHEIKIRRFEDPITRAIPKATLALQVRGSDCESALLAAASTLGFPAVADRYGEWRSKKLQLNAGDLTMLQLLTTAAVCTGVDWRVIEGILVFGSPARLWPIPARKRAYDPSIDIVVRTYLKEGQKDAAINQLIDLGMAGWPLLSELANSEGELFTSGDLELMYLACYPASACNVSALAKGSNGKALSERNVEFIRGGKLRRGSEVIALDTLQDLLVHALPEVRFRFGEDIAAIVAPKIVGRVNALSLLAVLQTTCDLTIAEGPANSMTIQSRPLR